MTPRPTAFAIPGDLTTVTGGYIYERRLLEGLRDQGRDVMHIPLGASFPQPSTAHMAEAADLLCALPADRALILDGFLVGAMDTAILARVRAPMVGMVHHPLAYESGLDPALRDHLFTTELNNLTHMRHVLVPSPHTAALLQSAYGVAPGKITIARPGTDRPQDTAVPVNPPLILSVGIQHPRKGHDVLLRALARIAALEWHAVIAGGIHDADHGAALVALLNELGLAGRVRLAGRVSDAALSALYRQARVFALATRYEGYGIVFDEAMAHGLPIVTCDTGAVPDTVAPGAGILVAPDDPAAFGDALARMLCDDAARGAMAEASRQAGALLPGWDDTARVAGAVLDGLA